MAVTFSVLIRTGRYLLVASLICAMAGSIIFATWHVTNRFTHAWEREAMREAGARAAGRGATYAGKINRHLLAFDKALERMAEEWEKNPDSFASILWPMRVAEYAALSHDMFLTDHNGLIRLASLGEFAGQSAAGLDAFREALAHAAEPPRLHVSKPAINAIMRQWHLDMTRPLRFPDGSFAGVLAMEYRLSEITPIFEAGPTDTGDFVAVFDRRDGQLRAAHVPGGAPPNANLTDTPLFGAVEAGGGDGLWSGPSPFDAVTRLHAYTRFLGRDLVVVTGFDQNQILRSVAPQMRQVKILAWGITGAVTLAGVAALGVFSLLFNPESPLVEEGRRGARKKQRGRPARRQYAHAAHAARTAVAPAARPPSRVVPPPRVAFPRVAFPRVDRGAAIRAAMIEAEAAYLSTKDVPRARPATAPPDRFIHPDLIGQHDFSVHPAFSVHMEPDALAKAEKEAGYSWSVPEHGPDPHAAAPDLARPWRRAADAGGVAAGVGVMELLPPDQHGDLEPMPPRRQRVRPEPSSVIWTLPARENKAFGFDPLGDAL